MRDPIDYYTNNLVPIVIEQSARGERSFEYIRASCASGSSS